MNALAIIQLVAKFLPAVQGIIQIASTNGDMVSRITSLSKPLANLLTTVGAELFPKAAPAIHIVGGVLAAFDPNLTKWLQGALNALIGTNLAVDGAYGPMTRAAVEQFQTKYGLKVDGLAGQVTQAAIQGLLAKLPNLTPVATPAATPTAKA